MTSVAQSGRECGMKILLIMADANMHKYRLGSFVRSAREAPLTLTTLAALTGDDPDIEYRLVDESVDAVPLDYPADLVGISVLTGTAKRCYALADHFRSKGIPVVLGGTHVAMMPEEARTYADSIVIGMADATWPALIADVRDGKLAREYRETPTMDGYTPSIPTPRWDLQRHSGYMMPYVVQATRGCMHVCDFCAVPVVWKKFQRRPIADVIRDIKAIPSRRFVINDVSPTDDVEYAKELFRAMIPLKKKWGGLATSKVTDDPELFDLLVKSGCQFLLIGLESVSQDALNSIHKRFNKTDNYSELMRRLHQAGIVVQGTFIFGFDHDGPDVFAQTVERVEELRVDIPRYSFYTPFPGTRLFQRLQAESRILSYDWSLYDTMHVVMRPAKMTPVELYEGFRWAYRETFGMRSIWRRTREAGTRFPIAFFGNLAYKLFVHRLYMSRAFEMPLAHEQVAPSALPRVVPTSTITAGACQTLFAAPVVE